jgi:hypothetical protein
MYEMTVVIFCHYFHMFLTVQFSIITNTVNGNSNGISNFIFNTTSDYCSIARLEKQDVNTSSTIHYHLCLSFGK